MPNHTTNYIDILEGDVDAIEKLIFNPETQCIDYNVLLPMPSILNKVISPYRTGENGRAMLQPDPENFRNRREATEEEQAEIDSYAPFKTWYEWASHHWGTKWNAYDTDPESYRWCSAWDAPRNWIDTLEASLPPGSHVRIISEFECGSPTEIFELKAD